MKHQNVWFNNPDRQEFDTKPGACYHVEDKASIHFRGSIQLIDIEEQQVFKDGIFPMN